MAFQQKVEVLIIIILRLSVINNLVINQFIAKVGVCCFIYRLLVDQHVRYQIHQNQDSISSCHASILCGQSRAGALL